MILGHVRDNFAYVTLALAGMELPLNVEFLIDTGFYGQLSLPPPVLQQLDCVYAMSQMVRTADGTESVRRTFEVKIDWAGAQTTVSVIEMDRGSPLLGVELLADNLVTLEMRSGGEVSIEPL